MELHLKFSNQDFIFLRKKWKLNFYVFQSIHKDASDSFNISPLTNCGCFFLILVKKVKSKINNFYIVNQLTRILKR